MIDNNYIPESIFSFQESPSENKTYGTEILYGRVDKTLLETEIGSSYPHVKVYVCGTRSYDDDMLTFLCNMHFPSDQIVKF